MPADGALAVWDRIFDVGERSGIYPVGIAAMDVARVEAGLILIEAEYTSARHAVAPEQQYSPYELGFEPLVDLGKATDFTGRRALRAEHEAGGPSRRLVGLELDWLGIERMFAKHGQAPAISPFVHRAPVPVYKEGKQVGRATSITWGTTIKKMVGFGSVDRGHAKPGTRLSVEWSVEGERGKVAATVVPLPFLELDRKRT
jgi:aminomethyltransferase